MPESKGYFPGDLETRKFDARRAHYRAGLETIRGLDYSFEDLIEHFPCFAGHMTLSRFLALYELYKRTLGVAGHIAEVGIYKGASLLWLAKMTRIFEPEALTQVHGFDWFRGMDLVGDPADRVEQGAYAESPERLARLIEAQDLDDVVRVHALDVTTDLKAFFETYPHLQFKMVFLDAGTYRVVRSALPAFWQRLTSGGVLVLDQFNHELSPGESMAVRELLPDARIETFPWVWMPTAFVVK